MMHSRKPISQTRRRRAPIALGAIAVAAVSLLAAPAADAGAITYQLTGYDTGSLDGQPFSGAFDIVAVGDTSGVRPAPSPPFKPGDLDNGELVGSGESLNTTITLAGIGTLKVTQPSYLFNSQTDGVSGFGSSPYGDFFDFRDGPVLASYDLASATGPVEVIGGGGQDVVTSDGLFKFSVFNQPATFTATLSGGVPEPAAWVMMLVGLGGLGAMLRRRNGLMVEA
jgi:hypothetical protein